MGENRAKTKRNLQSCSGSTRLFPLRRSRIRAGERALRSEVTCCARGVSTRSRSARHHGDSARDRQGGRVGTLICCAASEFSEAPRHDLKDAHLTHPFPSLLCAAHERRRQPAMHLLHQPDDGKRKIHLRPRNRRRELRGHRGHGQPEHADEEVRNLERHLAFPRTEGGPTEESFWSRKRVSSAQYFP